MRSSISYCQPPANAHVRLMIEGLMGSFIIGFLGTAGPRLLDARPLGGVEISALLALQLLSAFLHLAQDQTAGDIVFLVLLLLFLGMLLPAVLPGYRVANLHLTFIGGFTIILFTVSARVVLGHSGHQHLFEKRPRFLIASLALLILAMLARVSADFILPARNSHLVYAALIWLLAATIWACALAPKLSIADDE